MEPNVDVWDRKIEGEQQRISVDQRIQNDLTETNSAIYRETERIQFKDQTQTGPTQESARFHNANTHTSNIHCETFSDPEQRLLPGYPLHQHSETDEKIIERQTTTLESEPEETVRNSRVQARITVRVRRAGVQASDGATSATGQGVVEDICQIVIPIETEALSADREVVAVERRGALNPEE